jgi:hypothetical protein
MYRRTRTIIGEYMVSAEKYGEERGGVSIQKCEKDALLVSAISFKHWFSYEL